MPGIICAVSWDEPLDPTLRKALARAIEGLKPAGPSVASSYESDRVFIGVCGHDEANRVDAADGAAVALMGEIAEPNLETGPCGLGVPMVLARRLAAGDAQRLENLNGQSAVIAWDETRQTLHAVTDRISGVSLFVWDTGPTVVLSTHMLSLAALPGFPRTINRQAVADLMSLGCCIEDRTLFENVARIKGARHVTWTGGQRSERKYWTFEYAIPPQPRPIDDYGDELASLVRNAVKIRNRGPLIHTLSAGLDSRILAAAAAETLGHEGQHALTLGPPHAYDAAFAPEIARSLGIPHRRLDIPPGFFARFAREGLWRTDAMVIGHTCWRLAGDAYLADHPGGLVVNGNGGDHFHGSAFLPLIEAAPNDAAAFDAYFKASIYWKVIEDAALKRLMRPGLYRETAGVAVGALKAIYTAAEADHRLGKLDTVIWETIAPRRYQRMNYDHFAGASRVSQPLRDNAVTDFLLTLPMAYREKAAMYKSMIARHWPAVAKIVYAGTGLPIRASRLQTLRYRAGGWLKYRAVPQLTGGAVRWPNPGTYVHYLDWLRGPNREFVTSLILKNDYIGDLLDLPNTRQTVSDVIEGRSGDYGMVYTIAALALFRREFG